MRKLQILICLTPLALAACGAPPAANLPVPDANAGPFAIQSTAFTSSLPPDDWWKLYDDLTLSNLVKEALRANADLRVASANLERARAVLGEAHMYHLPSATIAGGVSYGNAAQSGEQRGMQGRQWSQNTALGVAWEADLFGRIQSAINATAADTDAVEASRDAVRVVVAAETTRAYLNVCAAGHALEIAQQSVEVSAKTFALIDLQKQLGSTDQLALERAGSSLASIKAALPQIEGRRQVALFALAALLGRAPADAPRETLACVKPPALLSAIPVGDGAALLKRRPDLRRAERMLAADAARVGVATADLYPRVSFGGMSNFFRNDFIRGSDSLSFSVGPLVSWSFPNVSVARSRLLQARAQQAASLATFEAVVIAALKEVEEALLTVLTQQQSLNALEEAQVRAERAFNLGQSRYQAGAISYLELLSAQAQLLSIQQAHAAALQKLALDRVELFKALGGGWREMGPRRSASAELSSSRKSCGSQVCPPEGESVRRHLDSSQDRVEFVNSEAEHVDSESYRNIRL